MGNSNGTALAKMPDGSEFRFPTLAEVYNDTEMKPILKDSAFQVMINQEPNPGWIKKHPTATVERLKENGQKVKEPALYIPIERIEWLLINIFLKYKVSIKQVQLIGNSVCVTVRLYYYDHIANVWHWQDGVGAAPLQTSAGTGANNAATMKSHAVMMAAPAAESYAIKDAAEKIGKLFGKDLNRADRTNFESLKTKFAEHLDLEEDKE
jgi:hypothetical protein